MNDFKLVCNFNIDLINQFNGNAFVIKTNDIGNISRINHLTNEHNKVHCIVVNHNGPLSGLNISEEWEGIPIHIFAPRFGNFMQFIEQRFKYNNLSIRVFLSSEIDTNYRDIQILSSLGIDCGIFFSEKSINWDKLNDLMVYSTYGKAHHASIQPFEFAINKFEYNKPVDFSNVYFDNPREYLHLSDDGKVALSSYDLHFENFITADLNNINAIEQDQNYKDYLNRWQSFFMKFDECSCCPAWRLCLGKFNYLVDKKTSCQPFFNDLMEAAEFVKNSKTKISQKELCQP
jgi:hypothetical protein